MPEVALVMSPDQAYETRALAETLKYELELQGVPSSMHFGAFPDHRPLPVFVLLDPLEYVRLEGEHAMPGEVVLRRTIFVCPPTGPDPGHVELLRRAGALFALDQQSVTDLQRLGLHVRLLRPGYSKCLDHFEPQSSRPIDAIFLGCQSSRRTRALDYMAEVLSRRNCFFEVAEAGPTATELNSSLAGGRWALLTQSKILINIHQGEEQRFEWHHALEAMHAGAVVVTEHSSGIAPLVAGDHLFVASADSMPYVVRALLRDEQRLARVRAQAYDRLRAWLPYALWVAVLRAAVVELVGEPVPEIVIRPAAR